MDSLTALERDRPVLEITPAMIAAGAARFEELREQADGVYAASQIFSAMLAFFHEKRSD